MIHDAAENLSGKWAHQLPIKGVGVIGEEGIPGTVIQLRYQIASRLSWRTTMLVCIALLALMACGNVATAATAPADTLDDHSEVLEALEDFLSEITETTIEISQSDSEDALRSLEFTYADADYEQVSVAGTFSDWVRIPMTKRGDNWVLTIDVPDDTQHYLFSVTDQDETWEAIDPDNTTAINHPDYGWVSVFDFDDEEYKSDRRSRNSRRESKRESRRSHRRFVTKELEIGQGVAEAVSYQRVDGLVVNPAVTSIARKGRYGASSRLHGNFGFSSGRFGGGLTVLKPLIAPYTLNLKLAMFDHTMPNNYSTGIGNLENSLAALFLHEDYRDYHRSKGVHASLVFRIGKWFRLEGGVRKEDQASLGTPSIWAAKEGDFRPNPSIDDGHMRSVFLNLGVGGQDSHAMVTYERSGDDLLGGDFEFERVTAKLRGRLELGRDTGFEARLAAGSNLRGELPAQRRFLMGGLGTVRGYVYQSLLVRDPNHVPVPGEVAPYGGQRSVLGNLEYYFWVGDEINMSVFYDAGMVWEDRHSDPAWGQLKTSAGIGFDFDSDEGPRVELIQLLDDRENPYVVQFRLKRSF